MVFNRTNINLYEYFKDKIIIIFGGNSGIGKEIHDISSKYNSKCYSFSRRNGCDVKKIDDIVKNK